MNERLMHLLAVLTPAEQGLVRLTPGESTYTVNVGDKIHVWGTDLTNVLFEALEQQAQHMARQHWVRGNRLQDAGLSAEPG